MGRAIYPYKSFAYAISFWFNIWGEYRFEMKEEVEANLSVKNENNDRESLCIIESNKGMNTLGVLLAPDGSINEEFKYLSNKVSIWAHSIFQSKISGEEAWLGMQSMIMKMLQYPLGSTTFS